MRIWSIHPKYLDAKGLVALWRESLLAKKVLLDQTKGYKNHPQLFRFKTSENPIETIDYYLSEVNTEALKRGYQFNKEKINWDFNPIKLAVTNCQIQYERNHLLNKLITRDKKRYESLILNQFFEAHPLFMIKEGPIEKWEIV